MFMSAFATYILCFLFFFHIQAELLYSGYMFTFCLLQFNRLHHSILINYIRVSVFFFVDTWLCMCLFLAIVRCSIQTWKWMVCEEYFICDVRIWCIHSIEATVNLYNFSYCIVCFCCCFVHLHSGRFALSISSLCMLKIIDVFLFHQWMQSMEISCMCVFL